MKKIGSSGEHRSKAVRFTLIELLVVIAIIAILAAILLPSLQQARQRGIAANCVSNQKQLGSIIMQYMNDYDGYWPRPKEAVSYWWYGLRFYLPAYKLTTSGTPSVNVSDRDLRKRTAPLFYCPAVFQNPYLLSQYREVYYVSPRWIRFGMASSWHSPKNDRVKKPGQKFLLVEFAFEGTGTHDILPGNKAIGFPHKRLMNVLHWDGHVASYPRAFPYVELSGNINNYSNCDYHWHPYYDNRSKKQ